MGAGADPAAGGFFVSLLTESFAVRALLGSVIATVVILVAVRANLVRSTRARRTVVLAPVLVALLAAVVTLFETGRLLAQDYLPRVWVTAPSSASGEVVELLGEVRVLAQERGIDVLAALWLLCAGVLVGRRIAGLRSIRLLLRRSVGPPKEHPIVATVRRISARLDAPRVSVRLLPGCPGGAFAAGVFRPVVVFDPEILATLDDAEMEGLVAHELAHVVRRDPLLAAATGVLADLAFFVPTLSVAARWFAREQEHSADEIASVATSRPGALASGILKVWRTAAGGHPAGACAAVPRLAVAGSGATPAPRLSGSGRAVVARVERLLDPPLGTVGRHVAELAVVTSAFALAVVAAFAIPSMLAHQLDMSALGLSYVPAVATAEESPAFATFHALTHSQTGTPGAAERRLGLRRPSAAAVSSAPASCPCLESQAELRAGTTPVHPAAASGMRWRQADVSPYVLPAADAARPLWTLDSSPGVGFFAVADVPGGEISEPARRAGTTARAPRG